jgi:hypothetical protein
MKNKFKYTVNSEDTTFPFDIETEWDSDDLEYVATDAAEDYHSNHDGWESHWPADFYIFDQDLKLLAVFSVEREEEPVFYANEKKPKIPAQNAADCHITSECS